MSSPLIARSPDLRRLQDEGYAIAVQEACLLAQVPYVDQARSVRTGTLVSTLNLAGDITAPPDTHVVYFAGDHPCNIDGSKIAGIEHSEARQIMGGVSVDRSFSNKPPEGYADYHAKIARYAAIISAPAMALDPNVSPSPLAARAPEDSPFEYLDNASSRVGITELSKRLGVPAVAICGLGGTGSYVLDLVVKTPIRQIHLFDSDEFLQHNAFRAPGAASIEGLRNKLKKVDYFHKVYSALHRGLVAHPYAVDASNVTELANMSFVFLCLDAGPAKAAIVDYLQAHATPFVDVGMGLQLVEKGITGIVRVTTSTSDKHDHIKSKGRISFAKEENNEYSTNIQIADLNALNAALAVVRWKKMLGFYADLEREHFSAFSLSTNTLVNDDSP